MLPTLTSQQARDAIAQGESETLELKSSLQPPADLAKLITSFANAKGGTVIIGVSEPNKIIGVDAQRATEILGRASQLIRPSIALETQTLQLDDKPIVLVHVPRSNEPVSAQGAFYYRQGTGLAPLTPRLIQDRVTETRTQQEALTLLSETVAGHTKEVESFKTEFAKANSWPRKIGIAAVGAAVGAALKHAFQLWVG